MRSKSLQILTSNVSILIMAVIAIDRLSSDAQTFSNIKEASKTLKFTFSCMAIIIPVPHNMSCTDENI